MPTALSKDLRNLLARVTLDAREAAERAARAALENLAVHEKDYRPHMKVEQRQLRNRLRARGRALGDEFDGARGTQEITRLVEDAAYEHWHRILFTKFLAENDLLHTGAADGHVQVTLQDCDELAQERGARDGFDLACRFASEILPGVFRPDDPIFALTLAANDQVELHRLVESLPKEVFTSDDGLGWTYQFWQAKRKDEVNDSGRKIGPDELPAVTQLFTEDYMVEFLLHNTIGAWWAGKRGPIVADSEEHARAQVALATKEGVGVSWTYLRLVQGPTDRTWVPAAGPYSGWPREARRITLLDPCMGSGHFLASALPILARLRAEEEGLGISEGVSGALRENLYGLELDQRCAQIGAFNVALTAWKVGGYQPLPAPHIACSGAGPRASEKQWISIGGADERLQQGMARLHHLFTNAPVLGSLINPGAIRGSLVEAEFGALQPVLESALAMEANTDSTRELAIIAQGLVKAAATLADRFTLVATNVPYLGRGRQCQELRDYCERAHAEAKADLASCFVERSLAFLSSGGTAALVTPQNWLFQSAFRTMRKRLLTERSWHLVAKLGTRAFQAIGGEVVTVALVILGEQASKKADALSGLDVTEETLPSEKASALISAAVSRSEQRAQLTNPEARVSLDRAGKSGSVLGDYCDCYQGVVTGDISRWVLKFWELPRMDSRVWAPCRAPSDGNGPFDGMHDIILWEQGRGRLHAYAAETRDQLHDMHESGNLAWGRNGVAINRVQSLRAGLYFGEIFHNSVAAIVPRDPALLPSVWAFCESPDFEREVRRLSPALGVTNRVLVQVPFAPHRWKGRCPPQRSQDPTNWVFDGGPKEAEEPLHVGVARLLGYAWPRQTGSKFVDCPSVGLDSSSEHADKDGIVCLSAINREQSAAQRLRALLSAALGKYDERKLLASAGAAGGTVQNLDDWLRDEFFERHCELFHHRPFIWHVWDGRKDGFHALVNYHRLDHSTLQKLTFSYLGDWIRHQEEGVRSDKAGADLRLGAARELQTALARILEGEAPYDIFVRWKPVTEQTVGWHPDLNDGVRMNIRPFVEAGVLRKRVKIKWEKDRGKEPHRDKSEFPWFWCEKEPGTDPKPGRSFAGHRWNNVHLTLDYKRAARR